jgi:hypothetical protein
MLKCVSHVYHSIHLTRQGKISSVEAIWQMWSSALYIMLSDWCCNVSIVWALIFDRLNTFETNYGYIVYLTMELHDFEDSKHILLSDAVCMILIWPFLYECFHFFYVESDKPEQNENIRCSAITTFCCQCAK